MRPMQATSSVSFMRQAATSRWGVALLAAALIFLSAPVWGQVYSGSITGVVTDPTGAVIPEAKVIVTDTGKGFVYTAATDPTGRYLVRPLPPSRYRLAVEASGFKMYLHEDIVLSVNQNISYDVSLVLGDTSQSVEVQAAVAALATQDAVTGQELNRTFVNDLPLLGRGVYELAGLAPGVTQVQGGFVMAYQANNFISNGSRNATADILLDGVSTTNYEQGSGVLMPLYTPSVDSVQEFKVQQSNFGADVGFSGSTVMNVVTRSGTNEIHGSAYWFLRNNVLTANDWFGNAYKSELAPRRYNMMGGTVGGPIKKDKTFYFASMEGLIDLYARTYRAGVPSAAMRAGDFRELCGAGFSDSGRCLDPNGQLWDPYSGVYVADVAGPVRSAFVPFNNLATYMSAGNPRLDGTGYQLPAAPGNLIDRAAFNMMQYFPLPNVNVGQAGYNRFDNWISSGSESRKGTQLDVKVDHSFSQSARMSGKVSRLQGSGQGPNIFGNPLNPLYTGPFVHNAYLGSLNHNQTFGARTLLNLSLGFARNFDQNKDILESYPDFDPITELGLPEYMRRSGFKTTPGPIIAGYAQAQPWSNNIGSAVWAIMRQGTETYDLNGNVSRMQGRHDLKIGGQWRAHRINFVQPGIPGGVFVFWNNGTSEFPFWSGGDPMASFLVGVGLPNNGAYAVPAWVSTQNYAYATYFQDNWRVTDRLTLTLGVRYEIEAPRVERFNRQSFLDLDYPTPLTVPGYPNLRGALQFVDDNNRSPYGWDRNNWGPRFGFAYKVNDKLVMRGGYGLFYAPTVRGAAGTGGSGVQGFSRWTTWINTYQNDGATPWGRFSDPFPITGPLLPEGSAKGAASFLGDSISGPMRRLVSATPYEQSWTLGFQRELPFGFLADANYVGKKGTKLYFGGTGEFNTFGPEIERYSPEQLADLFSYAANPFYGVVPAESPLGSAPYVPKWRLELPYPQFAAIGTVPLPVANSMYHAFQLRLEKRFSHGLQVLATYTKSRSIDDASVGPLVWLGGSSSLQNPNNRALERSLSQFDIPQIFGLSYVYELPLGRGKALGKSWHPLINGVLGGWKTNGIWRFSTGQPLAVSIVGSQALPTYGSQRPNLTGELRRTSSANFRDQYFANPDVVVAPAPFTIGNAPRTISSVRSPGVNNANLSLFKAFGLNVIRESAKIEVRGELFNAFNHPQFCGPNTTLDGGIFGQVTGTCSPPREVQLGLKLYW